MPPDTALPAADPAEEPTPAAPFLRWAGGKRRLLDVLTAAAPATFGRYVEPFFGGGALLFALHRSGRLSGAHVGDLNAALMCLYTTLRDDPDGLLAAVQPLAAGYAAATDRRAFYNATRDDFNVALAGYAGDGSADVGLAARMLLLNRTCFNGLWRVNSSGKFNVPWGKLKRPTIVDRPLLAGVSDALADVELVCGEYHRTVRPATAGDLVYLDPPYIPHTPTSSFSKYTADDFGRRDQFLLAGLVRGLVADGVQVMLSNADDTEGLARRIFGPCAAEGGSFTLLGVSVSRSISARAASRGKVGELLGVSYGPEAAADPDALAAAGVTVVGGSGPAVGRWRDLLGTVEATS